MIQLSPRVQNMLRAAWGEPDDQDPYGTQPAQPSPVTSSYNDPEAGGTITQPLPPQQPAPAAYGAAGDDPGITRPITRESPSDYPGITRESPGAPASDPVGATLAVLNGPSAYGGGQDDPGPSVSARPASYGDAGDDAGVQRAPERPLPNPYRTAIEAGRQAAEEYLTPPKSIGEFADRFIKQAMLAVPGSPASAIVQAAQQAVGDELGREVARILGVSDNPVVGGFSGQDIGGFVGTVVTDPTIYVGGGGSVKSGATSGARAVLERATDIAQAAMGRAMGGGILAGGGALLAGADPETAGKAAVAGAATGAVAGKPVRNAAGRLLEPALEAAGGVVRRVGTHLSENAERTAAADAAMRARGSTMAPAGFGVSPEAPAAPDAAPTFYSQLRRTLEAKMPNRASPEQIRGILRGSPVKPDEITWTGLDDWLAEQRGPVTRQQVLDFLDQNAVTVDEVVKGENVLTWLPGQNGVLRAREAALEIVPDADGAYRLIHEGRPSRITFPTPDDAKQAALDIANDAHVGVRGNPTRYGQYTLPGGENYRELLLTLPQKPFPRTPETAHLIDMMEEARRAGDPHRVEALRQMLANRTGTGDPYRSSHWDEPNVLAHVRFSERTGPDGKRILHVEEIQSDWHQQGRKQGYRATELPPDAEVIQNPFGWNVLQNGESISGGGQPTREAAISAALTRLGGSVDAVPPAPFQKTWPELAMKRMIRWAAENGFDQIAWTPGAQQAARYPGVGEAGMVGFYDQILPTVAQKLGKRFGARVGQGVIDVADAARNATPDAIKALAEAELDAGDIGAAHLLNRVSRSGQVVNPYDALEGMRNESLARYGVTPRSFEIARQRLDEAFRGGSQAVHTLDITPRMRESVMAEGQPLFAQMGSAPSDLGATGGTGALGAFNRGAAQVINAGVAGGVLGEANAQMNPDDPYARQKGFLAGFAGIPLAARGARALAARAGKEAGEGGVRALSTLGGGVPERLRPNLAPSAEAVAREAAAGPRLGRPVVPEPDAPSSIPLSTRLATKWTDARAGQRWAEDVLHGMLGEAPLPANAPTRPSNMGRINPGGIAEARVVDELEPLVTDATQAGLLDEVSRRAQDLLHLERLEQAYAAAKQKVLDARTEVIERARAGGRKPDVVERMQQKADADAERAGVQALRREQGGGGDRTYEATQARLQGQQERLDAAGTAEQAQSLVERLGAFHDRTRQRLVESGVIPDDPAAYLRWLAQHAPDENPIVAARAAAVRAEQQARKNEAASAFADLYLQATEAQLLEGAAGETVVTGAKRGPWSGTTTVTFMQDGKPVTIHVAKPVADGIEAAAASGMRGDAVTGMLKSVIRWMSSTLTSARISFLPVNLARDLQDYAARTATIEGGPQKLPAVLGTWFDQAGKAAADIVASNLNARTAAGAAVGAVTGAALGDEDTTISDRIRHGAEGALGGAIFLGANRVHATGKAAEFLARGGGSGGPDVGARAGARWLREIAGEGGAPVRSVRDLAATAGDWLRDIANLEGVRGINERTELISRTAAMVRSEARKEAPEAAVLRGRDVTYDPETAGTIIRGLNGYVQFLNATVQSGAQLWRLARSNPYAAAATLAVPTAPIVLAAEAWNRSDPDRAAAYDDVSQTAKDSGLVVMLPWAGSDARGERPNYLWIPTGMATPLVIGLREVTRSLPGLEPAAGRVGTDEDANVAARWADVLGAAVSAFSPLKGESLPQIGASMIPPPLKQAAELYTNKSLFNNAPIVPPNQSDERASSVAKGAAGVVNAAGRMLGSDALQNVHPNQVDYLIRQPAAYGDIITSASEQIAPSAQRQAEDRPVQNEPFVGGVAGRFIRDQGGANLQRAREERLSDDVRAALEDAGLSPDDVPTMPATVNGKALSREQQLEVQQAFNDLLAIELTRAQSSPAWMTDPKKAFKAAVSRAQSGATKRVQKAG